MNPREIIEKQIQFLIGLQQTRNFSITHQLNITYTIALLAEKLDKLLQKE